MDDRALELGRGYEIKVNNKAFNELRAPLYTISQIIVAEALAGNAFRVSSGVLSASSSQQMVMALTNPSGSGIRAVIDSVELSVNTTTLALMKAAIDGTVAGLSAVTAYNLNTEFLGKSPLCTIAAGGGSGVSLTGGSVIYNQFLNILDNHYPFPVVVTPGHSVAMSYTLTSGMSTTQSAFRWRWYEIPLSGGFTT